MYLRQGTAHEQVEMGISTQDRSGLEDSAWESIASRTSRGDNPSRGLHSEIIPSGKCRN